MDNTDPEKGHASDQTALAEEGDLGVQRLTSNHDKDSEHAEPHDEDGYGSKTSSIIEQHEEPEPQSEKTRPEITRTISAISKPISVIPVPRLKRGGLFGHFSVIYEAEEPYNYPRKLKWLITFWVGLAAVAAPLGSAIVLPALPEIITTFHTDPFTANLSVALYMLAMSVFPLWWSSFSETLGRRTVYVVAFTLFIAFNIGAALSTSIGMFIAMRFLSGGTSASVQAVGAGTVADIWEVRERGQAMSIFYIGPLCGPLIGPLFGGLLTEGLGWRSTQWFQVIGGCIVLIGLVLFVPETHLTYKSLPPEENEAALRPQLSRTASLRSVKTKTHKGFVHLRRLFIDPLKVVYYFRFPAVTLTVFYASVAFGALYFLNISVEMTFSSAPYNFSPIAVGCLYMFNSTGYIITSILGGKWVDRIMHREAKKAGRIDSRGKLIFIPEDRMKENAVIGAFAMPAALIWYGWTANYHVFFLAPMIANFVFGAGSMLIFAMATTMLTEFMPKRASNGVALNNLVRNIFAFVGTMAGEPAIRAIGNGWLFTIIGLVALASGLVISAMKRWGKKWRLQMDEALKD